MNEMMPAEVFPPGEFLKDELDARGWTQTEFAEIIKRNSRLVSEIIVGKRAITPETARDISAALGTSAQFWLNLESAYQLSKVAPSTQEISREAALREKFPVRDMTKRGWIKRAKSYEELEKNVFAFFGIKSIEESITFGGSAWRRKEKEENSTVQLAWLLRVRQLATALHTPKYSEEKLRAAVPDLERLMTEPEEARHVPKILTECGVRSVIVEPIPGSEVNGVCFWIDNNASPVIGLTLKGDHIDRFWFNLWHEIEHVLRGDGKEEPVLDSFEGDPSTEEKECERAANTAAAHHCVPTAEMNDFIARHNPMFSEKSLVGFSRLAKRHPGIVAGQIQNRIKRWDLFKKHQVKVRQIVIQTVLTDGYGRTGPVNL